MAGLPKLKVNTMAHFIAPGGIIVRAYLMAAETDQPYIYIPFSGSDWDPDIIACVSVLSISPIKPEPSRLFKMRCHKAQQCILGFCLLRRQ